jgi:hypothetical protein
MTTKQMFLVVFSYRWILQNKYFESWLVVLCKKPKLQFIIDFKPEFW